MKQPILSLLKRGIIKCLQVVIISYILTFSVIANESQTGFKILLSYTYGLNCQSFLFVKSGFYIPTILLQKSIKKTEEIDFDKRSEAWINLLNATKQITKTVNQPEAFNVSLQQYLQTIKEIIPLVKPYVDRPIALVQFVDSRHLRIYATDSPFGQVLKQLGFKNAWQGSQNSFWGETIEVSQLANLPKNSRFVIIKPYPENVARAIKYNVLWQKLDMARDPLILPAILTFEGLPSAQRFAELLANGLVHGGDVW